MKNQVGIRFEPADLKRIKTLADSDGRKISNFLRWKILQSLPAWERKMAAELKAAGEPATQFAIPGRSKLPRGKRGIHNTASN